MAGRGFVEFKPSPWEKMRYGFYDADYLNEDTQGFFSSTANKQRVISLIEIPSTVIRLGGEILKSSYISLLSIIDLVISTALYYIATIFNSQENQERYSNVITRHFKIISDNIGRIASLTVKLPAKLYGNAIGIIFPQVGVNSRKNAFEVDYLSSFNRNQSRNWSKYQSSLLSQYEYSSDSE